MANSRPVSSALLLSVAVLGTGCAGVRPAPAPNAMSPAAPSWSSLPDADRMAEAFPLFAALMGQEGVVVLACRVEATGGLQDCAVRHVSPTGLGFDRAALSLTREFRVTPSVAASLSGPDGQTVQFTLKFPVDESPRPAWSEAEPSVEEIALARTVVARYLPPPRLVHGDPGVDEDRQTWVSDLLTRVEADLRDDRLHAMAVSWARMLTPEQLEMLSVGQRRPSPPDPDRLWSSEDGLDAVEDRLKERLRAEYCARYSCELTPYR